MIKGDSSGWATLSLKNTSTDNSEARKYTLSTTEKTVIGRSPECQIALDPHEFITVSRQHAEIKFVDGNWSLGDLGTTNGTLVNDRLIDSPQELKSGDRITLGSKGPEFNFECLTLNATVMVQPTEIKTPPKPAKSQATSPLPKAKPEPEVESKPEPKPEQSKPAAKPKSEAKQTIANSQAKPEVESKPEPKPEAKKEISPTTTADATISETKTTPPVVPNQHSAPSIKAADSGKTLWNLVSATELCQMAGHSQTVLSLAFSPDGKILASTAKDKTIKLWSVAEGTEIATLRHKLAPNAVVFSPDSKTLASGGADKTIKLWNVAEQAETASFAAHKLAINALGFSPDGKTLASGSADKTIKLWNVAEQAETASFAAHKLAIESLAFSPDGKTLASGSKDKTIKLWNIDSKEEIATLAGHKQGIGAISFSPDGKILASAGADRTIIWNTETQAEIAAIAPPSWQTGAITIAPNGQTLAGSDEQGKIRLWQI